MKWWAVGLVREQCLHKAQGDKVRCKINLNLTLKCFALYHLKFELHLQMTKLDLKVLKMTSTGISQHICKWCKKIWMKLIDTIIYLALGIPKWLSDNETACQCRRCRRHGFNPWVGKIPLKEGMATHSSTIARKSHGQGSLVGYIPWSCKELDMTEHTCMHISFLKAFRLFIIHN